MEAFTVLIILLWIGCGIWSGSIASKKNRDTTGWFIIGIILGIFGVIIAYLVEPLTSSSDKKIMSTQTH